MDVSCHSFIRMAKLAVPLMKEGGSMLTVSFYGADRVVENYNLMGPVKAALESSVRYLAADLADRAAGRHRGCGARGRFPGERGREFAHRLSSLCRWRLPYDCVRELSSHLDLSMPAACDLLRS